VKRNYFARKKVQKEMCVRESEGKLKCR